MNITGRLMASAATMPSLTAGRASVTPRRAADDDKDKDKKDSKAEDDKKDDDDKDKKKDKSKAEGDDDDDKKKKDSKAEDDKKDDDDDEDKKKSKASNNDRGDRLDSNFELTADARERERGRIRSIVESDAGKLNPKAALRLALASDIPRSQAIATLEALAGDQEDRPEPSGNSNGSGLRERMARVDNPDVGPDSSGNAADSGSGTSAQQKLSQAIILAGKKRRGEA